MQLIINRLYVTLILIVLNMLFPCLLRGQNKTNTGLNNTYIRENKGQNSSGALYIASSPAGNVLFFPDHMVVQKITRKNTTSCPGNKGPEFSPDRAVKKIDSLSIQTKVFALPAAGKNTAIIPGKTDGSLSNYFFGMDTSKWVKNLPNYKELSYRDPVSGIAYTFSCVGTDIMLTKADQHNHGIQKTGITSNPLLLSASYIAGVSGDFVHDIEVDDQGCIYLCGETYSQDFPYSLNAYDTTVANNSFDGFVMKFDSTGNNLIFSTFIGGIKTEELINIAVKPVTHEVIVSGITSSQDFPATLSAFQSLIPGDQAACVFGLSSQGTSLLFSSFLGGPGLTFLSDMFVNNAGDIYLSGSTKNGFPTTAGSFQTIYGGDEYDMFLSKLTPNASSLIFSTYVGGIKRDFGGALAVDTGGYCYLGCVTEGGVPITAQAVQPNLSGTHDFYVCKLTPSGNALVFGTYFGLSTAEDRLTALATDNTGVVGIGIAGNGAFSTTAGAYTNGPIAASPVKGPINLFKLSPDGDSLRFSTLIYYGSGFAWTSNDKKYGPALCLDDDKIFFSYYTYPASPGWTPGPGTICAFDHQAPTLAGSCKTALFGLTADASKLMYLSYYGADSYTASPALTLRNNIAFLAGVTNSTGLPMTITSYDSTYGAAMGGANGDGYYARLKIEIYPGADFSFPGMVCRDTIVYFQNLSHCSKTFHWDFGDGDTTSLASPSHIYISTGTYTITLVAGNDAGADTLKQTIIVQYDNHQFFDTICEGDSIFLEGAYQHFSGYYIDSLQSMAGCDSIVRTSLWVNPTPWVNLPADTLFCAGSSLELNAGNPGCTYLWNTGNTTQALVVSSTAQYTVTVTSPNACDMYGKSFVTEVPMPFSTLSESAILCRGDVLVLQTDTCPDCQYLWNNGSTQASVSITDPGIYFVKIYNPHCEITDTTLVEECARLVMPNIFTPNGDGFNDFFIPDYANVDSFELTIYNRWGRMIAKTNDLSRGWDGTINNTPCPDGTYFFLAEFQGPGTGGKETTGCLKGTVTLLR